MPEVPAIDVPRMDPENAARVARIMAAAGGDLARARVMARRERKPTVPLGVRFTPRSRGKPPAP